MAVSGPAEARQVVPGTAFHDRLWAVANQGAGVFKHVTGHIFDAVGTPAQGNSGDRAGAVYTAAAPVGGLWLPVAAPGKIATVIAASGFFPFQGRR